MKPITFDEKDLSTILKPPTAGSNWLHIIKQVFGQLIILALIYFVVFYALNYQAFWKRVQFDDNKIVNVTATPTPHPTAIAYSPQIDIPKIGISAPIIMQIAPEEIISNLKNGVVHYQYTALPGQIGNTVFVGHSSDYPWSDGKYKTVFALLDKLENSDVIIVSFGSQKLEYTVSSKKIVKPTELSILDKSDQPILTLLTCYPVGTSRNRMIITAQLTKGETTGTQTVTPFSEGILPKIR